jgi:solute carrier family 25 protein 34/35
MFHQRTDGHTSVFKTTTNTAITAVGPAFAAMFTNPADVAKTRLNMDRELQSAGSVPRYSGTVDCVRRIWAEEGMAGVQRGLSFALVREVSKGLFRYGLHEPIMNQMHQEPTPAPFSTKLLAGFASGAIAAVICNPLDLIKTRLQLEATHAQGAVADGAGSGPFAVIAGAVRREGLSSLMTGTQVSVVRSMLGNGAIMGVNLQLNEWVKDTLQMQKNVATDAFCAFFAATACVAVINPVDVVRTRLYSQPLDEAGAGKLYAGAVDAVRKIVAIEGPLAFYKGVTAHFIRVGPHVVITFMFINSLKRLCGTA